MNKNKLIFSIIWIIIFILIVWGIKLLNSSWKSSWSDKWPADFVIWTYDLDKTRMDEVVEEFKSKAKEYEKKNIVVENFPSYDDYKDTLQAAIIAGKTPDVFMLNNFERSYLENYVSGINPNIISPNQFRKWFKTFFWNDLIRKWEDENWKETEFVIWIPVWYETLGIYFNRKFVLKPSDLESWAWVSNLIDTIKERNPDIVPLWIMNWSVDNNADVLTQFFMYWEWEPNSLDKVTETGIKEAFWSFDDYINSKNIDTGESDSDPQYYNPETSWSTNLELFSQWNEAMIIGYTSMINSLKESGFNNSFLYAAPFPHYFSGKWKTLVKYNYFVVNQHTVNDKLAYDFLAYLATEEGSKTFLSKFTYLLPALVTLEQDKLQEKLHDSYNLILWDFYKPEYDSLLSSFDKWIYSMYDQEIRSIIKDDYNFLEKIKTLQKVISCKYKKLYNIENLSKDCSLD